MINLRDLVQNSLEPVKGSLLAGHPIEVRVRSLHRLLPLRLLAAVTRGAGGHRATVWVRILERPAKLFFLRFSKLLNHFLLTDSSSIFTMLLSRSLSMLMKGVAPIPRPTRSRTSYFLLSCAGAPYGPSISSFGKLELLSERKDER